MFGERLQAVEGYKETEGREERGERRKKEESESGREGKRERMGKKEGYIVFSLSVYFAFFLVVKLHCLLRPASHAKRIIQLADNQNILV